MTLLELFDLLRKHVRLVLLLPVGLAVLAGVATAFMPDKYTATTDMYVLVKSSNEVGVASSGDLSASQMLTNDVTTLIKSDRVEADAAESVGFEDFDAFDIDVTSSTTTRVISLSVTGTDPKAAAKIANALVDSVSSTAQAVMDVQSINQIDSATAPEQPSGPNRPLYRGRRGCRPLPCCRDRCPGRHAQHPRPQGFRRRRADRRAGHRPLPRDWEVLNASQIQA